MENVDKIVELKNEYIDLSNLRELVWMYHPSNPDFVNPIKEYERLTNKLDELEFRISTLEREINSLN